MGKNQSASGLTNVIQYNNGNITFVSGSTTLMSISSSGAITTTGVISGSNVLTASYANNAELLDGLDSTAFATTGAYSATSGSLYTVSSSAYATSGSLSATSGSLSAASGSFNTRVSALEATGSALSSSILSVSSSAYATSGSLSAASGSFNSRVTSLETYSTNLTAKTASFATTGSNTFIGSQVVSGSLTASGSITATGTITAQTLVVQTITSSVVYSSGSNVFGNDIGNSQRFTGSVLITGSLTIAGASSATSYSGTTIYGSTVVCSPVGLFSGCVGIGVTEPTLKLDVRGTLGIPAISGTSQYGYLRLTSNAGSSRTLDFGGYDSGRNYAMWMQVTDWADLSVNSSLIINPNGGNVGIGTCTPGYKLDVNGEVAISPNTAGKNTFLLTTNASNDGRLLIKSDTTNKVDIQSNGASYFMGGNIGINCSTPNYKLHVNGCTAIDGNLRMGSGYSSGNSTDPGITVQGYSNAGVYFSNCGVGLGAGSSSNLLFLSCIGNVGIGICTPIGKLHVYKNGLSAVIGKMSDANILIDSGDYGVSTYNAQIAFGYYSGTFTYAPVAIGFIPTTGNASGYGDLTFNTRALTTDTAPLERMRITSGGNVGLSTVAPASLLSAYNTTSTAISQMYISGPASNGTGGGNRGFDTSFTSTVTSFTGTDNGDQGYGYFPLTIVNGQTYTIHFKSTAVNGTLGTIITSTGTNFATDSVQTISLPTITDGALTSIRFTATGAATYIGFAGYRTSGTMSLTISEVSIVSGIPDIETGAIVAYKGIATNRINIQAPTTSCIPVLGCADCTTGLIISGFDTRYGMLLGTLNTGAGWIQQGRYDGTATSYPLSLNPNGGKIGIGATNPNWLLEICCNTTATGGGGYPAIAINNPNDAGYSAYYFFKGTTNMGGMEVSNATCDFLLNTNCTLSFKTNNNTRIRICNTGESYFACKPSFPGATLTCTYTCTYSSYTAGCWLGLFAGDNGYNGAYAFTVVGQFNLGGSAMYSINFATVPYIHKSTSIEATNGNDFYGISHTSAGHADNGALVCFRRVRYSSNTPVGNRTEFCMNVSYSTSFTATTYVLAWV